MRAAFWSFGIKGRVGLGSPGCVCVCVCTRYWHLWAAVGASGTAPARPGACPADGYRPVRRLRAPARPALRRGRGRWRPPLPGPQVPRLPLPRLRDGAMDIFFGWWGLRFPSRDRCP